MEVDEIISNYAKTNNRRKPRMIYSILESWERMHCKDGIRIQWR
jgi:hypothetical protein